MWLLKVSSVYRFGNLKNDQLRRSSVSDYLSSMKNPMSGSFWAVASMLFLARISFNAEIRAIPRLSSFCKTDVCLAERKRTTKGTTMAAPPSSQMIDRHGDSEIVIESLTATNFDAARKIENEFLGAGKGLCFGLCPYRCCPISKTEFEPIYRESEDRCSTYGVAVREADQLVVGICKLRQGGQPSKWDERLMHEPAEDEMYVDCMAVTKEARGKGVGTNLLKWAEKVAGERNATKLSLGVVNGNPAKRLYYRVGYVDTDSDCFWASLLLGRPNGQFGALLMEKPLS